MRVIKSEKFKKKIFKVILSEIFSFYKYIVISMPGRSGVILRKLFWKKRLNIQEDHNIGRNADILYDDLFEIGKNFILGDGSVLDAGESNGVYIGNYVGIARNCFLRSANHKIDRTDVPWMLQGHKTSKIEYMNSTYSIVIEDDVWIGANVTILSGAHLSKGVVVVAGSVVSGFVKPYSVIIGNPARMCKSRLKEKNDKI